ncbi:hypothetical protein G5B30_00915 [Sphingobacterium sp. SGG-5]|uniref:MauE/DoxX family redox-associated membrane protein n=1 Tax=Sphingobacterium sp. SGG-5 TaxID=2710881 RepID=UPI0013ED3E72|nr:MauE/DoxX family redox-associated membrane protein [Sphingobacterium sp. SGG-5]NGM60465.1 hypothetical protein [Sphingobacterium sp. SGG-5]
MKTNTYLLNIITILLIVFWLYVALDKLWNLDGFHASLLKQPFPNWWADVLFWLLPLIELGVAAAFIRPLRRPGLTLFAFFNPFLLSSLLMFVFTVYIGLGVAGIYAKRPCSCASVFRSMSWERHLIVNIALLGISLYGYYLSRKDSNDNGSMKSGSTSFPPSDSDNLISGLFVFMSFQKWFCRTFALFPGRPVLYKPK